jgi:hypothetical protein
MGIFLVIILKQQVIGAVTDSENNFAKNETTRRYYSGSPKGRRKQEDT